MEAGHRSAVMQERNGGLHDKIKIAAIVSWDLVTSSARTEIRCSGSAVVTFYPDILQAFRDIAAS